MHVTYISKQSISVRANSSQAKQQRRTANYHPPVWDHRRIESLTTPYTHQRFGSHLEELKRQVKLCLISEKENLRRLELIDILQRLGVAYHFEKEIKELLDLTYLPDNYDCSDDYGNNLRFRLLRNNYYPVQSVSGDDIFEESNCRMLRLETRDFIHLYENDDTKNLVFLELAKLDYNLVQSIHQRDLIELSKWWRDLNFKENLPFSRDRLVENFIWAVGIIYEPQFSECRIGLTKFICILSAIDDIYDIYGSLEELELFTQAVSRWNIQEADKLPMYMKLCYLAMFNFANGICYDVLKDQGINVLPYIAKEWESLCKSYLTEAKWFNEKYTPTFDEYLKNAWISVGGPAAMVHFYVLKEKLIKTDLLDCLIHKEKLSYWASLITRLSDDLGTSKAEMVRGDVKKSIQCYMKEMGTSMEESEKCIKRLRSIYWRKYKEACVKSTLPKSIIDMALNMARTSQSIYEHVDGTSDRMTNDLAITLFINQLELKQLGFTIE